MFFKKKQPTPVLDEKLEARVAANKLAGKKKANETKQATKEFSEKIARNGFAIFLVNTIGGGH